MDLDWIPLVFLPERAVRAFPRLVCGLNGQSVRYIELLHLFERFSALCIS
jgi:hypothetical protein